MTRLWSGWVAFTGRPIDSRPLRLVRVLIACCILGDLFAMTWRGALDVILLPPSLGGLSDVSSNQAFFAGTPWAGGLWFALLLASLPLVALGIGTRPALVVALFASAQLGHLYVPGDRAIDRLLRTVMLLFVFSDVSSPRVPARIAAWPQDLIRWILVIVYLQAGIAKLGAKPGFLDLHDPELYAILAEPMTGRLDPVFWARYPLVFTAGGAATLLLELSSPLLLTRWCRWWAVFGAAMHVGIACTMELGMFPFGMLALYPVLFTPWTEQLLDRVSARLPTGWQEG